MIDIVSKRQQFLHACGHAGWHRRILVSLLTLVIGYVCLTIALWSAQPDLRIAGVILVVSLAGFSAIAWLTFDATRAWRLVDYPWVLASFVAVLVALTSISESARREQVSQSKAAAREALSTLNAHTKFLMEDCKKSNWFPKVCPQIQNYQRWMEMELNGDRSEDSHWGERLCPPKLEIPEILQDWRLLCQYGQLVSQRSQALADQEKSPDADRLSALILKTKLHYWYYILAFFVGLRVSKITAELLQTFIGRKSA